jgi:hypothetical protein
MSLENHLQTVLSKQLLHVWKGKFKFTRGLILNINIQKRPSKSIQQKLSRILVVMERVPEELTRMMKLLTQKKLNLEVLVHLLCWHATLQLFFTDENMPTTSS